MKKLFLVILVVSAFFNAFSQSPQSFSYQMVVRDAGGVAMVNQTIGVQISIMEGPLPGTVVYTEEFFNISTNDFGIVNLAVGSSPNHTGDFSTIPWGNATYFLKLGVDPSGGSTYADMGTTQLLSVPYALHAQTSADAFSGNYSDLNGVPVNVSTFNNDAGYITSPNDADADPANEIQVLSINNDTIFLSNGGFIPMSGYLDTLWRSDGDKIYNTNNGNVGVGINDPNGKMVVKGDANLTDSDPLFEVKNRDGQTVFVVYPDSVRIFVGDDDTKTNKGVFAVSGRNSAKNMTNNYLWVTPDSTRIFLDSLNSKGGFAVKSFGDALSKDFFSVYTDTNQTIDPSQKKILWYPAKSAFLSGRVLIEHPDSVGTNSWATGFESKATGDWSQALGYQSIARGTYSTAIGKYAIAESDNSFAFGDSAYAKMEDCYSFGAGAQATGLASFAIGSAGRDSVGFTGEFTRASGDYSFAFGSGTVASMTGAFAMGFGCKAEGPYSFASGYKSRSSDWYGTAIGRQSVVLGQNSTAVGAFSVVGGDYSTSVGVFNTVNGDYATGIGYSAKANGSPSVSVGMGSQAMALYSSAFGVFTYVSGDYATAMGSYTNAKSAYSFVIGRYNNVFGDQTNWIPSDPLFQVGNGSSGFSKSDAFIVYKNGNAYTNGHSRVTGTSIWNRNGVYTTWDYSGADESSFINHTGGTSGTGIGGFVFYNTADSVILSKLFTMSASGNLGQLYANPTEAITLYGAFATPRKIVIERNGYTGSMFSNSGSPLYIVAGGAALGTTNKYGGATVISSGISTGSGSSIIIFQTATPGASGIADNNPTTKMVLDGNGNLGIGTLLPGQKLDIVQGNGRVESGFSWLTNSDARYKSNITTFENVLEKVMAIRGVRYDLISDNNSTAGKGKHIGFIAQEIEKEFPELVITESNGYKSVAYSEMTAVLIEAVKAQQLQIEQLKKQNEELGLKVSALEHSQRDNKSTQNLSSK